MQLSPEELATHLKSAKSGNVPATLQVGAHYEYVGDAASARELYHRAAIAGNTEMQFRLGRSYREGNPRDDEKAFEWLQVAANAKHAAAAVLLALMYKEGAWPIVTLYALLCAGDASLMITMRVYLMRIASKASLTRRTRLRRSSG